MLRLRAFTTLVSVLFAITVSTAFAQTGTSSSTATITSVKTMTVDSGGAVALSPALGAPATASTPTVLSYETNDGLTYSIVLSVEAGGWGFTPGAVGATADTYPVLTVDSSVADDNTATTTTATGTLIDAVNALNPVSVASAITNAKGTLTVTLGASVTETVVAGDYAANLTYTFTGP